MLNKNRHISHLRLCFRCTTNYVTKYKGTPSFMLEVKSTGLTGLILWEPFRSLHVKHWWVLNSQWKWWWHSLRQVSLHYSTMGTWSKSKMPGNSFCQISSKYHINQNTFIFKFSPIKLRILKKMCDYIQSSYFFTQFHCYSVYIFKWVIEKLSTLHNIKIPHWH